MKTIDMTEDWYNMRDTTKIVVAAAAALSLAGLAAETTAVVTGHGREFLAIWLALNLWAVTIIGSSAVYFVPTIVAAVRRSTLLAPIAVVNMFLGWTLIGWVVALAMAVAGNPVNRNMIGG
jgi:hypothetical protein